MLGENVNWVRNVRAAGDSADLRHGRREAVRLVEVPADAKPAILRCYVEIAPGTRPHVRGDHRAPQRAFEQIAARSPVFRITARAS